MFNGLHNRILIGGNACDEYTFVGGLAETYIGEQWICIVFACSNGCNAKLKRIR
ncbi:hypothetical protein NIE33_02730 [Paraburkholderia madseniana]|nr:hypothetical protein [Paraburkholderia madseniana]MDQ6458274.1 hypothetical protein [Paraburkholderia madseniana]